MIILLLILLGYVALLLVLLVIAVGLMLFGRWRRAAQLAGIAFGSPLGIWLSYVTYDYLTLWLSGMRLEPTPPAYLDRVFGVVVSPAFNAAWVVAGSLAGAILGARLGKRLASKLFIFANGQLT